MTMNGLEATNLHKSYGKHSVLRGIDLSIAQGEILVLLGRNAQGKSTLGRLLAKLETPDSGAIIFPRGISEKGSFSPMLVPQNFVVWPHLTTETNVSYGTRGDKSTRKDATDRWLKSFDLYPVRDQLAGTLSYGQQQRLALARAFAFHPSWIILDETFSHLDSFLRHELINKTAAHCREEKLTTLWITHDIEEAFAVADRVAILEGRKILQIDTPEKLYQYPRNAFVAKLTGRGTLLSFGEWKELKTLLYSPPDGPTNSKDEDNTQFARFLRPEQLKLRALDQTAQNTNFRILSRQFIGDRYLYKIACENFPDLLAYTESNSDPMEPDTPFCIELSTAPCILTDHS